MIVNRYFSIDRLRRPYNHKEMHKYPCYFNGIPNHVLYDNIKTVVIRHTPKEIRLNQKFEDFLGYYAVRPKAHNSYLPRTKEKVERMVDYIKRNFFNTGMKQHLKH